MRHFRIRNSPHRQIHERFRIGKMSWYTALIEWHLIEEQRKCGCQRRTNWLLRPSIAGDFQECLSKAEIPHQSVSSVLVNNKTLCRID